MKKINVIFTVMLFIAVITGCKKDDEPTAYDDASFSKGGIMYDKFWSTAAGYDQASQYLTALNASSDFFRCKQCHAWDGLGNAGSYINRAAKTSRPNVAGLNLYQFAQDKSAQELFNGMKETQGRRDISYDLTTYDPTTNFTEGDKMPNYSQLLSDEQIWDIVKFMKAGMFDVTELYDATYTGTYPTGSASYANIGKDGNESNGNEYYTATCVACHGADGKGVDLEGMSLGKFIRSKPAEVQHKIKYGQLGSIMVGEFDITVNQLKDLYKACSNTANFPD